MKHSLISINEVLRKHSLDLAIHKAVFTDRRFTFSLTSDVCCQKEKRSVIGVDSLCQRQSLPQAK
jgi:hypothetical protein